MPFEAATSLVGLARWKQRSQSHKQACDPTVHAVHTCMMHHAQKWAHVSSRLHLGLALMPRKRAAIETWSAGVKTTAQARSTEVPYWQQSNRELDTQAMWDARLELRHHPTILPWLDRWWACAVCSLKGGDCAHPAIRRDAYVTMSRLHHKAMIEEWDEADADACAAADWETDAVGKSEIGEERFKDCIFELADLWTTSIHPEEYAAFLQRLMHDVATSSDGTSFCWKGEHDTNFGGYVTDSHTQEDAAAAIAGGDDDHAALRGGKPKKKKTTKKHAQSGGGRHGTTQTHTHSPSRDVDHQDSRNRHRAVQSLTSSMGSENQRIGSTKSRVSSHECSESSYSGSKHALTSPSVGAEGRSGLARRRGHADRVNEHQGGSEQQGEYELSQCGHGSRPQWRYVGVGGLDERPVMMDWGDDAVPTRSCSGDSPQASKSTHSRAGRGGSQSVWHRTTQPCPVRITEGSLPPLSGGVGQQRETQVRGAYGEHSSGLRVGIAEARETKQQATEKMQTAAFKIRWMHALTGVPTLAKAARRRSRSAT